MIKLPEPRYGTQWLAIQTYRNVGEPSDMKLRARALPGQGFPLHYKVECSEKMRKDNPEGTCFIIQAKITEGTERTPCIYTHHLWHYKRVTHEEADIFIAIYYGKKTK